MQDIYRCVLPIVVNWPHPRGLISAGSAVLVHTEGWIVTALHYEKHLAGRDPRFRWSLGRLRPNSVVCVEEADLLIGQLEDFDSHGAVCATLRDGNSLKIGEQLTLAGFPFRAPVDQIVRSGLLLEPGLLCRDMLRGNGSPAPYVVTSAASVDGMSGGGHFDKEGRLCAVQSLRREIDPSEFADLCGEAILPVQAVSIATHPTVVAGVLSDAGVDVAVR